jgi:NADPH2:quinone reductase
MKAVTVRAFGPIESIGIEDLPDPVPEPGEVVIDVVAAETNYPDLLVIEGKYQFKPPLPFSPGKAAAGFVAAIGPRVRGFSVGDRVLLHVEYGAYAEKLRARTEHCFKLPDEIDFAKAAALGLTYQTAHFALKERANLCSGDVVFVLGGAGGVGVASVQIAKALGAGQIIAGVRGSANAEVAKKAGADHVIDLSMPGLRDSLKDAVSRLTNGHGADIVIDPVGGEASAAALRTLAWRGRMVIVGFASGEIPAIKANYLLVKNIAVSGLQSSDYRDRTPELFAEAQKEIFALYAAGKIDPYISRRLSLAQFKEALIALRNGEAKGKIILDVRPA